MKNPFFLVIISSLLMPIQLLKASHPTPLNLETVTDANVEEMNKTLGDRHIAAKHVDNAIMARLAKLTNVKGLSLHASNVTDEQMSYVAGLTNLQSLILDNTHLTDKGIIALSNLPKLKILILGGTGLTDVGLDYILKNFPNLEQLDLEGTQITDSGAAQLVVLRKLTSVYLPHQVSKKTIDALQKANPELEID